MTWAPHNRQQPTSRQAGFTLLELTISLVLIGILVALLFILLTAKS